MMERIFFLYAFDARVSHTPQTKLWSYKSVKILVVDQWKLPLEAVSYCELRVFFKG